MDVTGISKGSFAADYTDAVFLHQVFDTANQCTHYLIFAVYDARHIRLDLALDIDAEFGTVKGFLKTVRGSNQRFRGNTADIQTGSA